MDLTARITVKVLSIITAFVAVLALAYVARVQLIWIGTAIFLSIALNPLVERFSKYTPKHSRGLAVAMVFVLGFGVFSFLVATLAPPLVRQTEQLVGNLPGYTDELVHGNSWASEQIRSYHLVDRIKDSQTELVTYVSSASGSFLSILQRVFASFAAGITILVLTIFMLLEGPRWVAAFWESVPNKRRERSRQLADQMYRAVTGYMTGYLIMSLVAAAVTIVLLTILDVPTVIMSNKSSISDINLTRLLGVREYLIKSELTPDDVVAKVRHHLHAPTAEPFGD